MQISDQELLAARAYPQSYTPEIIKNIELLSFSDDGAVPFGSYPYKAQKFPGDIDLTEIFEECCNINQVIKKFAKKFQQIVGDIVKLRKHYMTEAKIGEDSRYDVGPKQIGYLDKGRYLINENVKKDLRTLADLMYSDELISENEYENINAIASKKSSNH